MHALVLAHEPLDRPILSLVLVELDQVPEVPARLRHRLVSVVERGRAERHAVPLDASHFARLAADTRRGIDQLANLEVALHPLTGGRSGVPRNLLGL
jgi:hypothetical protein